jgi:peroxiredoxin Q/BCP
MRAGDSVSDFELADQAGTMHRLRDHLARGPVVLFFYPAAMTPGCTRESCHFRDAAAEFASLGAQRIGVSADDIEKQKRFAEQHDFDYPLLSDRDRTVARRFGVTRPGPLPNRRTTFVIDTDGTVLDVVKSEFRMSQHVEAALAVLRRRAAERES